MIRNLSLLTAGAVIGALAMGAVQADTGSRPATTAETFRQLSVFGEVFERVRSSYVTPADDAELVENAISGMLSALDPHSSYLNEKALRDMQARTRGEFGGLGIEVTMEDDLVRVISPMEGTPAAKAGVLAGDFITEIDGTDVRGLTLNQAVELMRGKPGDPVSVVIRREGAEEPVELTLERDVIRVRAVRHRVEGDVGYIRINSFMERTTSDLHAAVADIRRQVPDADLKGYVLDLRLNPGGLLDQAVGVSDSFLGSGEIVSTRGRDPRGNMSFSAREGDVTDGKPVIVLINGGSASASEIVAGALKDHGRATVVGSRSFGKGSVQTVIPLDGSGAIRLTTSLYYMPGGQSIQGTGVTPDVTVEQPLPPELLGRDVTRGESALRGHIRGENEDEEGSGSSVYVPQEPEDDVQLQHALGMLRGGV